MTFQDKKLAVLQRLMVTQDAPLIEAVEKLIKQYQSDYKVSDKDFKIAEKRRADMKSGKVKGVDVFEMIREARKRTKK